MSQVDIQKLQQMVEALTRRVKALEEYAETLRLELANNGIYVRVL